MTANNIQHGGTHYKDKAVQPWDYIINNNLGYLEGNVVKYITRADLKGNRQQDLAKAMWYLQRELGGL